MNIARRYGTTPAQRGSATGQSCPDLFALEDGNYLVIGKTTTPDPEQLTKIGASVGPDETAVVVPADCMHAAVLDITQRLANSQVNSLTP